MKSKDNSYNCGSPLQLWYRKARGTDDSKHNSRFCSPQTSDSSHWCYPALFTSHLNMFSFHLSPFKNPRFVQLLCLWASFQGKTQRLSRSVFETRSRLLARKPIVPTPSVEKKKKSPGKVWQEKASYAVSFGGGPRSQIPSTQSSNRSNCRHLVSASTHCSDSLSCPFCNLPLSAKRV